MTTNFPWAAAPNNDIAAVRKEIAAGKLDQLPPKQRTAYMLRIVDAWDQAHREVQANAQRVRVAAEAVREADEARQSMANAFREWAVANGVDPNLGD